MSEQTNEFVAGTEPSAPAENTGVLDTIDLLLKSPARLLETINRDRRATMRLVVVAGLALVVVGLVCASTGGGIQWLLAPLKIAVGIAVAGLLCLPSLHILACLAGARQSAWQTTVALIMGVTLMSVLLAGFAPVAWIFSQASGDLGVVGALHICLVIASAVFGVKLMRRAITEMNGNVVGGLGLWGVLFVVVLLQMSTVLRPILGPASGEWLAPRQFFLAHWFGMRP